MTPSETLIKSIDAFFELPFGNMGNVFASCHGIPEDVFSAVETHYKEKLRVEKVFFESFKTLRITYANKNVVKQLALYSCI